MSAWGKRALFTAFLSASLATALAGRAAEAAPQASANAPAAAAAEPAGRTALAATPAQTPAGQSPAATETLRRPTFAVAGTVEAKGRTIPLAGVAVTALDLRCGAGAEAWPCGRAARTALQRFVRGRTLECETPEGAGSAAARCAVGGRDVGAWLVSQGWTAAAGPAYAEAEKTARQEQRGIWSPLRPGPAQAILAGLPPELADAVVRAEVELSTQSMTVTYRGEVVGEWPVSTAREGKETPTGAWSAQWLSRDHRSKLYDNAPMPYAIFFEGDYAIHGTYQTRRLGSPASHGCVRLSPQNAKLLFNLVSREGVDKTLIVIRP